MNTIIELCWIYKTPSSVQNCHEFLLNITYTIFSFGKLFRFWSGTCRCRSSGCPDFNAWTTIHLSLGTSPGSCRNFLIVIFKVVKKIDNSTLTILTGTWATINDSAQDVANVDLTVVSSIVHITESITFPERFNIGTETLGQLVKVGISAISKYRSRGCSSGGVNFKVSSVVKQTSFLSAISATFSSAKAEISG